MRELHIWCAAKSAAMKFIRKIEKGRENEYI